MYIQRSVQSDEFISLTRHESFNYDSSDTSLPDLSANGTKHATSENGVTLGIVRFCIVLGGILFVIIITGVITYIYRKKLLKSRSNKQNIPPTSSSISYILDYYEHDYTKPTKSDGITVMKINKVNISIPSINEDIQSLPITTSQISAPMPNASVSIYNKERANSLARSVENLTMISTITPPVPALASINYEPKTVSRNISKGSKILNPTSRGSEMLKSTSRGSEMLQSTSRGSEMLQSTSRGSEMLRSTSKGSEMLKSTSRGSEISNATSFVNILPEIFDDSTENAAPIDINPKWFTYPIDSPTIPLTPSHIPKDSDNNDEQSGSDESVINDIPEVYDRKSKRNLRIRIDTFDQFNLTQDKPYTSSVTFTPKSELKEDEEDDENKSTKVDTNKLVQDVQGSDKYKSFGTSSTKNNQHKRNGNIFEHKYLLRSKTIN